MTNFDFLQLDPQFGTFGAAAITAERLFAVEGAACAIGCRRAMEFAVKWMYSVDGALQMPWQDTLVSLMGTEEFRDIVGPDLHRRMDYIRRVANGAAHSGKEINPEQAELCLENLFYFMDFVACCYGDTYEPRTFDRGLLGKEEAPAAVEEAALQEAEQKLNDLLAENESLKAELTARREAQQESYVPKPLELTEYATRKLYIDQMLRDADWVEGKKTGGPWRWWRPSAPAWTWRRGGSRPSSTPTCWSRSITGGP